MAGHGFFITVEGGEGAGKTTTIKPLIEALEQKGYRCLDTREPGGTELGKSIRQLLLQGGSMASMTELMLYAADRAEHVNQVIRPALAGGQVVVCDRFVDSTTAYQGFGRQLDMDTIHTLNHLATGGLMPDLTLWLDLPPTIGLQRVSRRANEAKGEPDRLEKTAVEFHERLHAGFHHLAQQFPVRIQAIDATRTPEEVSEQVISLVLQRLSYSASTLE